jgi:hypothetical protein
MGSKSSPAPPDYVGAAKEQAAASAELTNMQTYANRPEVSTPFGGQTWSTQAVTDPATGQQVTQWTQNTTLAPQLQQALDSQMAVQQGRSDLAQGFMQNVANSYQNPFNWQGMPDRVMPNAPTTLQGNVADYAQGLQTGFGRTGMQMGLDRSGLNDIPTYDMNSRNQIADDLMARMQPTHDRQAQGLQSQLTNQGFQVGSEAYNKAMGDLMGAQSRERFNALDMAGNEAQRMYQTGMGARQQGWQELLGSGNFVNSAQAQNFGQNQTLAGFNNAALGQAGNMDINRMQAMNQAAGQAFNFGSQYADQMARMRQQAISEEQLRRAIPLNEMNALLTGQQVGMPSMPSFNTAQRAETPQLLNATNMQYQANLAQSNAQNAGFDSMLSSATGLAGAAMPYMFSDARLKTDIRKIGEVAAGISLYRYRWVGSTIESEGVLAQEVQKVRPDLVRKHASGYLQVNYGGL